MKRGPSSPPKARRRWVRRVLILALGLVFLLTLAFLFRKPLFSGMVLSLVRSEMSNQLGVPVEAEAIEGDWWSTFELRGVSFSNAEGPIRNITDATVTLWLEPLQLPHGALGALRSLEIRAQGMELAATTGAGQQKENDVKIEANEILPQIISLFPDGVLIEIEELVFGSRRGKTRLDVAALSQESVEGASIRQRSVTIQGPEMDLSLEIQHTTQDSWAFTAEGKLASFGEFLRDLGIQLPIDGGKVDFHAGFDTAGLADGNLRIQGMRYEGSKLENTVLSFQLRDHQVRVPKLQVELPGLQILAKDLLLPHRDWNSALDPGRWQGSLGIKIQDLEPYRSLLPEIIRRRLPIQGELEGELAQGKLLLSQANLKGRGFSVHVDKGKLPVLGDYRRRDGELQGHIEVTEGFDLDVAPMGRVSLLGKFEGRWTGSIEQPVFDGLLDARAQASGALVHVTGRARSAANKHTLEEMTLKVTEAPEMQLVGNFELDAARQQGSFKVQGTLDSRTLEALKLLPILPRHVICRELVTETRFIIGEKPGLDGRLSMAGITSDGRVIGRLDSRIEWRGGEELHISEFVVQPESEPRKEGQPATEQGNVRLKASGSIPLGKGTDWNLGVEAENLALDFVGPFLSLSLPRSRLDLSAKIRGPFESPSFSIDTGGYLLQHSATLLLALSDEQIRHLPQLPLKFRCKLDATPFRIHVERLHLTSGEGSEMLRLDGSGSLPFGTAGLAKDLPVDLFRADFQWKHDVALAASMKGSINLDTKGIALGPLEIEGPDGSVQGELRANFPVQDLLRGRIGKDKVKLAGKLTLNRLDIGKLPRIWMKDLDLTGILDGELILGGSLAKPEPRLDLRLEKVGLKVRGAPRIESLDGQIEVLPQHVQVKQMKGKIGVGDFTVKGGLETQGLLWEDFDQAELRLELQGKDLMLVRSRGLRLLGNTHLLLTGTPRKIKVGGEVAFESGKYNERQSLLMIDPSRKGGASVPGFVPFELEGELGKRVTFDVKLTTVNPFLIRTGLVDADVNAQLRLQGPGSHPYLVGAVTALRGWIRMPSAKLRLEQALIFFKKDRPLFPELDINAVYRRKGHEIRMRVQGSYDKPALLLTSSPHLEYEQILVFLSTGQLPRDLEGRAMESMMLAAGSYGANELWSWLVDTGSTSDSGESFFDRFSVESGQDFGTSGIESMRVEYKLDRQWFVQVERDADGFFNLGLVFRINF